MFGAFSTIVATIRLRRIVQTKTTVVWREVRRPG